MFRERASRATNPRRVSIVKTGDPLLHHEAFAGAACFRKGPCRFGEYLILQILARACSWVRDVDGTALRGRGDTIAELWTNSTLRQLGEFMLYGLDSRKSLVVVPSLRDPRRGRLARTTPTTRVLFLHGMDTYAEFQACLLEHQGWSSSAEWITASAPHRGADFSGGAGGSVLRARFGYEPRRSRSWRLISQYSVTSRSQAEMFARIRRATDAGEDEYGLLDDWSASVDRVIRTATEQAPVDGIAGISEGGTVGAVLFSQHLRGDVFLGSGYRGKLVLTFCALTSPAHSRTYADPMPCLASLHLTGAEDTADVWHMGGQTAALFGPWSGLGHFCGGHKLPKLSDSLRRSMHELRTQSFGLEEAVSLRRPVLARSAHAPRTEALRLVRSHRVRASIQPGGTSSVCGGPLAAKAPRARWQGRGTLRVGVSMLSDLAGLIGLMQMMVACHVMVLF